MSKKYNLLIGDKWETAKNTGDIETLGRANFGVPMLVYAGDFTGEGVIAIVYYWGDRTCRYFYPGLQKSGGDYRSRENKYNLLIGENWAMAENDRELEELGKDNFGVPILVYDRGCVSIACYWGKSITCFYEGEAG